MNPPHMTLEQMQEMINLSESMIEPQLERIKRMSSPSEQREAVIMLVMALGFGVVAVARTFFSASDPIEFGRQIGAYIGETIKKLKEAEDDTESAAEVGSAWDIH